MMFPKVLECSINDAPKISENAFCSMEEKEDALKIYKARASTVFSNPSIKFTNEMRVTDSCLQNFPKNDEINELPFLK